MTKKMTRKQMADLLKGYLELQKALNKIVKNVIDNLEEDA